MDNRVEALNVLLKNLPIHLYWVNTANKVVLCNDQQAKTFGLQYADEIIGKTIYEVGELLGWKPNIAQQVVEHNQMVIETLQPQELEETFLLDERERIFLAYKLPWYDNYGKPLGIFGFTIDITERKHLERELAQAKEQAESANEIKTQFIKNMAHDLRTPFGGIYSMADLLYRDEAEPKRKSDLKIIADSAQLLLKQVNTVLEYAQIELKTIPLRKQAVDLRQLADELIKTEQPAAIARNLNLSAIISPEVPVTVMLDDYRLKTILLNLLGNALKFTKQGAVTLYISLLGYRDDQAGMLKITVADTGIGLPKDKIKFIKEKFNRLTPADQGEYLGSGLGLATIKAFLVDMAGEVYIDSVLGEGSKFNCIIPFITME